MNTSNLKTISTTSNIKSIKPCPNNSIINFYIYLVFLNLLFLYALHGKSGVFWFNHLNLNNFTISVFYIFTFVSSLLFILLHSLSIKVNLFKSIDYLFSISNLVLFLPFLFFSNTVFTFLFFLEIISTILLYKLISSKIWFKADLSKKVILNNIPQNYINMVFFQYWVTFFSTVFIVYFYINMYFLYGTTEWSIIQCTAQHNFTSVEIDCFNRVLIYIFLFSMFLKLGITPFHLFKVEVYKGIPLLSIFFYTTYYFLVLFLFFIYILSDLIIMYVGYYYLLLCIALFVGMVYVFSLLFDVSLLKVFFTYSTVINSIGFLIAFIASI